MSTIVTRAGKGTPLTNNEVDANFVNLNTDKIQTVTSADSSVAVTTPSPGVVNLSVTASGDPAGTAVAMSIALG